MFCTRWAFVSEEHSLAHGYASAYISFFSRLHDCSVFHYIHLLLLLPVLLPLLLALTMLMLPLLLQSAVPLSIVVLLPRSEDDLLSRMSDN